MNEKQKPVFTARHGAIEASVWLNENTVGRSYGVSFSKSYSVADANGKTSWKTTRSFRFGDLADLNQALKEAHAWIRDSGDPAANGQFVPKS